MQLLGFLVMIRKSEILLDFWQNGQIDRFDCK